MKMNRYRSVEITITMSKSSGCALRETEHRTNLISDYATSGIKTARTLSGLIKGTGEANHKCKEKRIKACMGKSESIEGMVSDG
jgi:hypothetical protein